MTESQKCTATTAAGIPCRNHAMRNQDPPPLCAVHRGRLGNRTGNQNARKHGFYRPALTPGEIAALITHAENMTLEDELALSRVMLRRLMDHLKNPDLPVKDLSAIAPLVFTGARTVAHLLRHIAEDGRPHTIWDEVLDQMARDLDIHL